MDIELLYKKFLESGSVSTDTRKITPGSVFFALKGPKFNANSLAAEALKKGAGFAVVDEKEFAQEENTMLVEDALNALQELAKHHRNQLRLPVIGLTGSNGKTTTKELIHAVLEKKYETMATVGNLNNHIGVPLSVLSIKASTQVAVVEMGANHVGEIAALSAIAKPTHGLITNIGKAHIGTFGGFENIIRAKSELYQYLETHEGKVFINSKNQVLRHQAMKIKVPYFYPSADDYYHTDLISADPFVRLKTENGEEVQTHLIGDYNFENIAAALCIGKYFEVDAKLANAAVAGYIPQAMRSQLVQQGTNLIILDAYNANPSSMEVAIKNLSRMNAAYKVAILGDMYELERESDVEHRKLGELLQQEKLDEVYLCGLLIRKTLETFPKGIYFADKEKLVEYLRTKKLKHATILIKASRGMGLETVVDELK